MPFVHFSFPLYILANRAVMVEYVVSRTRLVSGIYHHHHHQHQISSIIRNAGCRVATDHR